MSTTPFPPPAVPGTSSPATVTRAGSGDSRVRRRTLVAGLAGAGTVLLGACQNGTDTTAPAESGPRSSRGDADDLSPEERDEALAGEVATVLAGQLALLQRTARRHPGMRDRLRPWARLHRAHQRALADATPDQEDATAPPPGRVPRRPRAALRQARSATRDVQQQLAEASVRAQSGAFAQLLASMAAGTAQHLAAAEES